MKSLQDTKKNKNTVIDILGAIVAMGLFIATMFTFNVGGSRDLSSISARAYEINDNQSNIDNIAKEFGLLPEDITLSDDGRIALLQCKSKLSYVNVISTVTSSTNYSIVPISDDSCFSVVIKITE